MIKNVLSRRGAKFACFDLEIFYLDTPMKDPEYVRVRITDLPQEFIDVYGLDEYAHKGWVYFEIVKAYYVWIASIRQALQ